LIIPEYRMKLIFLLSCLTLCVAQDDIFVSLEEKMDGGLDWLANMIKEHFLSEDGTSFKPEIVGMLVVAEPHICPVESNQCSPSESWLLGCSCRKSFRALGECKKMPCTLFRQLRDSGPDPLNRFINAQSYEERFSIVNEYLVYPISRALCECPGMIGTSIKCVTRYDGALFEMTKLDRTNFDNVVRSIDWKSLKTVLLGYIKAGCGEKNGKDCVVELSKMYTLFGTVMDNTFNEKNECLSMIRFEEDFTRFMKVVESFDMETQSFKSIVSKLVDAAIQMEREVTCDPECAGEISDSFYSCCTKHALKVMSSKPMKRSYLKLYRNIWSIFAEGAVPNISKAVNKYLSIFDLESFCGTRTDVYRLKNQQCEALED
jgi:hypothetical protein